MAIQVDLEEKETLNGRSTSDLPRFGGLQLRSALTGEKMPFTSHPLYRSTRPKGLPKDTAGLVAQVCEDELAKTEAARKHNRGGEEGVASDLCDPFPAACGNPGRGDLGNER